MKLYLADTSEPIARNRLLALQCDILPADVPTEVDTGLWWFAFESDVEDSPLVAFCGLDIRHQGQPLVGFLTRSGVHAEYRGRGYQRQMIRHRVSKAKALGLQVVVSDTQASNPASSNSLIACGFLTFVPAEAWRGEGTIYWKKELFK